MINDTPLVISARALRDTDRRAEQLVAQLSTEQLAVWASQLRDKAGLATIGSSTHLASVNLKHIMALSLASRV